MKTGGPIPRRQTQAHFTHYLARAGLASSVIGSFDDGLFSTGASMIEESALVANPECCDRQRGYCAHLLIAQYEPIDYISVSQDRSSD